MRSDGRAVKGVGVLLFGALWALSLPPCLGAQEPASPERPVGFAGVPEDGFDFYDRGPYRDEVPRPDEALGYPAGTLHTSHSRMVRYFESLAEAAPDRVRLEIFGESYEQQPLILAFISSPENLERREAIRAEADRLADPRATSPDAAAEIASRTPATVWLDYGNDGNETAALEASMQVAYQLAAGEGEEIRRLREEALVIINPDHNPESHDRHASWYNAFGIGAADPAAMEHHAPWGMSTNNNHYQIDLNRDGWGLTQRESQAVAAKVLEWRPQVFVDHHGQTEHFYFPPPVRPVNPYLPDSHLDWYDAFGRSNAAAFDREGWQYYTRDVFDLFYPGYFDSWPSLRGAIGMTYETDGGGSKGLRWERQDGSIATFRGGIAKHFTASLATIRTAAENREDLLRDFAAFFRTAVEQGEASDTERAFALDPGEDPRRAASLAATLLRHGIEVSRAEESFESGARHHRTGETSDREFPAGTYVVDAAQPQGRAAANYLTARVELDSVFVRRELARWSRNARRGEDAPREGHEFYDVTAWSLPLAFGVDAYALSELPAEPGPRLESEPGEQIGSGDWTEEISFETPWIGGGVGPVVGEPPAADAPTGAAERTEPRARSAYLFRPEPEGSLRLLVRLLAEGFRVAVSERPLTVEDRDFPRGTFVLRVDRNPESMHERVDALAREAGVEVWAAHTAWSARGQTGVGSGPVRGLRAPRIAVLADEGVRTTSYGHAWFTLERRYRYPFTPIRFRQLRGGDMDRFDVIVLPDGSAAAYGDALGEGGRERLRGWIERGGTLVAWGGGSVFAVDADLVSASLVGREADADGVPEDEAAAEEEAAAEDEEPGDAVPPGDRLAQIDALPQESGARPPLSPTAEPGALQRIPGAILRAELDLTHWLTLGYPGPGLPVPALGSDYLTLSETGSSPVYFPEEGELRLSGFVWPGNTGRLLRGSAHAVVERSGRGQVVLFNTDPNYRLVWRSTARLFANALFLGPTLGTEGAGR